LSSISSKIGSNSFGVHITMLKIEIGKAKQPETIRDMTTVNSECEI
jgi:hypothetical protein